MQWIETKVTFACDNVHLAVELIADVFHDLSAKGVVVDDPELEPAEGWGEDAVAKPSKPAVTGYFPANEHSEKQRRKLKQALSRMAPELALDYTICHTTINEEDWAEAWKAFFWPEEITPTIAVKPTWRQFEPSADQIVIEIDPGMAFGTGTHPTTALCIRLLEKYVRPGDAILDVGTGSGILLIAAAKLGAGLLSGIDRDPLAVDIAKENLDLNRIAPDTTHLQCADQLQAVSRVHDIIVANILAEVILDLLEDIDTVLKPDGVFICSGIIEAHQIRVAEKMAGCGFDIIDIEKEGDWVAFAGRNRSDSGTARM